METSEQINEVATALAKAQPKMQAALKDRKNEFFKSNYATLSSVWEACRDPLGDAGLSVVQLPVTAEAGRIALTTMLMHASGQYIRETFGTKLVKDDPQGVGSGITYLRRYALSALLGIVTEDDDDGNDASQRKPPPQQQQPAAKPKPIPAKTEPSLASNGDYEKTFLDLLDGAAMARDLGANTAGAVNRAMGMLKSKYGMDASTVTPGVAGRLLKAMADGKFDTDPAATKETV